MNKASGVKKQGMRMCVLSLGGSLMIPEDIDVDFLRGFRSVVLKHMKRGMKFIIICGGGRIARRYMRAAEKIVDISDEDKDWLGIHATRLNAHLLRTLFKGHAYERIIKNPNEKIKTRSKIVIAAGYKPGFSTDYDAVLLAKNFKANEIINMSNIDYVYDKDPKKFRNAKPLREISWKLFRKLIGSRWDPGLNAPFDPVASRAAEKLGMTVFVIGKNLKNFDGLLMGRDFRGSIIK